MYTNAYRRTDEAVVEAIAGQHAFVRVDVIQGYLRPHNRACGVQLRVWAAGVVRLYQTHVEGHLPILALVLAIIVDHGIDGCSLCASEDDGCK